MAIDGGAPIGNSWNDGLNWSTNTVPGPGDTVVINVAGPLTVTFKANATVGGLVLGGAAAGTKTLDVGVRTLTINGGASIEPNGILSLSGGTLAGTDVIKNDGVILSQTTASTISKQIANNGTINVSQNLAITGQPKASASGTINIAATRTLTFLAIALDISGRTLVGTGTLDIRGTTALNLASDLTLASNTTPVVFSGSVTVNGPGFSDQSGNVGAQR